MTAELCSAGQPGGGCPHVTLFASTPYSPVEERPFRAAFSRHRRWAFRPSGATGAEARLRLLRDAALKRRSSTVLLRHSYAEVRLTSDSKNATPYSSLSFSPSSPMPIFESR